MVFDYDPARHRADLAEKGYAHLKGVLSKEFVAELQSFLDRSMAEAANESDTWKIKGKKRQFVFEFSSTEAASELRRGLAALTGIAESDFTISERHLKVYDDAADPYPAPHKDRSASHYSIGLPVRLPEGSSVCVFPEMEFGHNTEPRAVFMAAEDPDARRALYASDQARLLNEEVGDVVIFLGSRIYHERVRGAGTAILYIKCNGEGDDPLSENIYAEQAEPA